MRKAGLKRKLDYIQGYRCGLNYCKFLVSEKDYQPTVILDYLINKIRELDKEIKDLQIEIYGWSEKE